MNGIDKFPILKQLIIFEINLISNILLYFYKQIDFSCYFLIYIFLYTKVKVVQNIFLELSILGFDVKLC